MVWWFKEFGWIRTYYKKKKNSNHAASLLEQAVKLETYNLDLYFNLAQEYRKAGRMAEAKLLAEKIKETDPKRAKQMDEFIKSLK